MIARGNICAIFQRGDGEAIESETFEGKKEGRQEIDTVLSLSLSS